MDTISFDRVPFVSLGGEWHALAREGYHADYAGIWEMYDLVNTPEEKIDRMRRWGGDIEAWTARDGGRLVGLLTGDLEGDRLIIYDFFVTGTHRRRGIGRALLAAALAEPGLREVAAEVNLDNAASRALFESAGFELAGAVGWYVMRPEPAREDES
jgi:ribosomal protein S18 acetylase RimI-like enzyme